VDFFCAYLLFGRVYGGAAWVTGMLLYNFCAFALQMPFGLLADRLDKNRIVAAAGCALVASAYFPGFAPVPMCMTAGVGNALFHVGGGVDVLNLSGKKAGLLGVFISPGAFGIFFGAALGKAGALPVLPAVLCLASGAAAILLLCKAPRNEPISFEGTGKLWAIALCLFLVVVIRSYAGFLFAFPWKTGPWATVLVCSVVLGKTAGGFLSDQFGLRRTVAASLGLAALLFLFSDSAVCGVTAVLLFNMTMPVTLRLAADVFPGAKGFSFGLLTFALFGGFACAWLGLIPRGSGGYYAALSVLSAALLVPSVHRAEV
jgi:hypothetical protein